MKKILGAMLAASVFMTGCSIRSPRTEAEDYTMPPVTARVFFDPAARSARDRPLQAEAPADAALPQIAPEQDVQGFSIAEDPARMSAWTGSQISVRFRSLDQAGSRGEETPLFVSQIRYPVFALRDRVTTAWLQRTVDAMIRTQTQEKAAQVQRQAVQDHAAQEGGAFYTYSYYADLQTARLDAQVASLLQMNSTYSGGAHPNNLQRSFNFDLVQHRQLSLQDVLLPGASHQMLELLLTKLEEQVGSVALQGLYPEYRRLATKQFGAGSTENWYFSREGLTVYFNCYDIAPYAAGVVDIEMKYEELHGLLAPAFFPASCPIQSGSEPVVLSEQGTRALLSDPAAQPDNPGLLLSAQGVLTDLRVYEVGGWVSENTPIVGALRFACDRLSGEEAVELSIADGQEYVLVFQAAENRKHACILSADGIMDAGSLIIN